jgi:hypothetical protein
MIHRNVGAEKRARFPRRRFLPKKLLFGPLHKNSWIWADVQPAGFR